jgi:DNA-binding CsgD family transcriptional regulator
MGASLEQLSGVLGLIHQAAVSPEGWARVLPALARLFEAQKASILDIDSASSRLLGIAEIGHDAAMREQYARHFFAVDPTAKLAESVEPLRPCAIYEQFDSRFRSRNEYFAFARRADIGDALGTATHGSCGRRSVVAVQRAFDRKVFDGSAKHLFELIAPHLEIAKQVEGRIREAQAARDSIAAGLDRFSDAAFILDESMKIRHLNVAASRLLAADRRVRGAAGRLSFADPRLNCAYQAAVRAASAELPRSRVFGLPAASGRESMELTVCPLQDHHPLSAPWQVRLVLVVLSARRRAIAEIVARMRQVHGLTAAEAHVVALLASGRAIDEIAAERGVRRSTLRAQLKSIRAKTGVARQAELVQLALAGAPIEIRPT